MICFSVAFIYTSLPLVTTQVTCYVYYILFGSNMSLPLSQLHKHNTRIFVTEYTDAWAHTDKITIESYLTTKDTALFYIPLGSKDFFNLSEIRKYINHYSLPYIIMLIPLMIIFTITFTVDLCVCVCVCVWCVCAVISSDYKILHTISLHVPSQK